MSYDYRIWEKKTGYWATNISRNAGNKWHEILQRFSDHLQAVSVVTRRIYLKAASRAVRDYCKRASGEPTETGVKQWLASLSAETKVTNFGRIAAFERFLSGAPFPIGKNLRKAFFRTVLESIRARPLSSETELRDLALLAVWSLSKRGRGGGTAVRLDELGEENGILTVGEVAAEAEEAAAIRRWLKVRRRMRRPGELRLLRRDPAWGDSPYIFPGRGGKPLNPAAVYAAMRRFKPRPEAAKCDSGPDAGSHDA